MNENYDSTEQSQGEFPSHDAIAQRAYELWDNAGRPTDRDVANWLDAENELRRPRNTRPPSAGNPPPAGRSPTAANRGSFASPTLPSGGLPRR